METDVYESSRHIWSDDGVARTGEDAPLAHLADLIDRTDPAFGYVMEAVVTFERSGIELSEETVAMAIRIGRHKHATVQDAHQRLILPPDVLGAVVYYVRRGAMVKIGTTGNLRARMTVLLPDEVLATEPGSYALEAKRHREFLKLRVSGKREWFHAGPLLQDHILRLRDLHGIPDPTLPVLSGS